MIKPQRSRTTLLILQIVLIGMLIAALTLSALAERQAATPTPTVDVSDLSTLAAVTEQALATQTVAASTPTLELSPTPPATETPAASPTPTPQRVPILRTGIGDSVFYPQKWVGPAVVRITYDGSGTLVVWAQNANGDREALLANTTGPYRGDSLIDVLGSQRTLRFEVRTAEAWQIEVLPLTEALHTTAPSTVSGTGDQVLVVDGSLPPDLLVVDASTATGSFSIWAYGDSGGPVITAAAPYAGTVALPRRTTALAVKAVGPWRLEITTR
jgi:hypothetical protein